MTASLNWMFSALHLDPQQHQIMELKTTDCLNLYKIKNLETTTRYYLKQNYTNTLNEGKLIKYLSTISQDILPILDLNKELNSFITPGEGDSFKQYLKHTINYKLLLKILLAHLSLQKNANTENLTILGCETLDLEELLPKFIYKLLLLQNNDDQNTNAIFSILKNTSIIHEYIKELRDLNLPYTLSQNDFNTEHVLLVNNNIKLIDFTDVIITCPIFSLCTYIQNLENHYKLEKNNEFITNLISNYVVNFESLFNIPRYTISKGLQLANFLYPIYYIATLPDYKLEEALTKNSMCANRIKQELSKMLTILLQRRDELWN